MHGAAYKSFPRVVQLLADRGRQGRGLEPQEQVRMDPPVDRRGPPARQLQALAGDHRRPPPGDALPGWLIGPGGGARPVAGVIPRALAVQRPPLPGPLPRGEGEEERHPSGIAPEERVWSPPPCVGEGQGEGASGPGSTLERPRRRGAGKPRAPADQRPVAAPKAWAKLPARQRPPSEGMIAPLRFEPASLRTNRASRAMSAIVPSRRVGTIAGEPFADLAGEEPLGPLGVADRARGRWRWTGCRAGPTRRPGSGSGRRPPPSPRRRGAGRASPRSAGSR